MTNKKEQATAKAKVTAKARAKCGGTKFVCVSHCDEAAVKVGRYDAQNELVTICAGN
jgi:hypothetical protein